MSLALALTGWITAVVPIKVAVLPLTTGDAALTEAARSLSDQLAAELGRDARLSVITTADVATLLGLERQKQLLGCSEDSCVAELTGALGAVFVVSGALARVDDVVRLDVQVLSTARSAAVVRESRGAARVSSLYSEVPGLAEVMTAAMAGRPSARTKVAWGLLVGGAAFVAAGAGLVVGTFLEADRTRRDIARWTADEAFERYRSANQWRVVGLSVASAGAVAVLVGLLWPRSEPTPAVTVWPTPHGVALGGAF
jgi:TolB-like protein